MELEGSLNLLRMASPVYLTRGVGNPKVKLAGSYPSLENGVLTFSALLMFSLATSAKEPKHD